MRLEHYFSIRLTQSISYHKRSLENSFFCIIWLLDKFSGQSVDDKNWKRYNRLV